MKNFTEHINAGNYPFPQNVIMLDITEFKNQLPSVTNQSYFLQVNASGTPTLGTITSFSLGNVTSTDVPRQTINNVNVCVTLFYPAVDHANVTIPEFPTFLLCPLIAAVTLLATIMKRRSSE
jgi:hypothetical protein